MLESVHFAEEIEVGGLWWEPVPLLIPFRVTLVFPSPNATSGGGTPKTDTDRMPPGTFPTAYYLEQEARTTRTPTAFIPEETRGSRVLSLHPPLLMRGLLAELLSGRK